MRPYLTKPLTYFLLSLIIVLPMALILLHAAVNVVHRAQPFFAPSISDIQLNDSDYTPGVATAGTAAKPLLKSGDRIGDIACAEKGFTAKVYYGANRVSYRNGIGLSGEAVLPGQGQAVQLKGYATVGCKALDNLEEGDIITFTTGWGVYQYEVLHSEITAEPTEETGEVLVIHCAKSSDAFANAADEKLYVTAGYLSGPELEEVAS